MLGAVYVKDFRWEEGKQPRNVPLGKGRVNKAFFETLRKQNYSGPLSLHVEYLPNATTAENVKALRDDLATLKKLLN